MTSDPGERLQAAAKDAIRAARSMLDAVEELVDDRDRVRDLAAGAGTFLADLVEALVDLAGQPGSGRGGAGAGDDNAGPGSRLRRLRIDGPAPAPASGDHDTHQPDETHRARGADDSPSG